jgi:ABC-type uncharacterized transport system permease subunit
MNNGIMFHAAPVLATCCYLAASAVFVFQYFFSKRPATLTAGVLIGVGFVFHVVFLLVHGVVFSWWSGEYVPVPTFPYSLSVIACLIAGALLVFRLRGGAATLGVVAAPLVSVLMLASASMFHWHRPEQLVSWSSLLWFHVVCSLLGDAAFVFAFCASVMLLVEERLLRAKQFRFVIGRLPSLVFLDLLNGSMVAFGFSAMVAGFISGIIYAMEEALPSSELGPRIFWSLVILSVYGVLVFARAAGNYRGARAAWLSVVGFLVVVASFFCARAVGSGIHGF